jgi:DNA/RNA-binding domain of Phe-tRNA-synthetase-like protein
MEVKDIQISDSLEGIARVGVLFLKQIANGPVSSTLRARIEELSVELRRSIEERALSEIESVARTRRLYRLVGIDPTRDRPSSEKLLRRVMRGKPLAKVNKLVDAVNFVSLRNQCPMSVYDWDKVVPPVLVRIGQPGEGYQGLSNVASSEDRPGQSDWVKMHGKLAIVDGEGPFGNPSHDSRRTQITLGTVRALVIAWAPAEAPRSFLESVLREIADLAQELCDARVAASGIL